MSKEGNFLIYCIEQYKVAKRLNGKQVSELFTRYRVWEYIHSCFEASFSLIAYMKYQSQFRIFALLQLTPFY